MNLFGKTIVVMGAAGRLGEVIVSEVLDSGGNVVAVDSNERAVEYFQSKYAKRTDLVVMNGDMSQACFVRQVIETGVEIFGSVDGAVNTAYPRNANYGRQLFDVTYEDFCENVSLHLGGYYIFMQQCAKYSLESRVEFSLVNMSSIYGVIPPKFDIYSGTKMTMPVEYAAIKSALQHLVSYFTAYTKGTKFRVNCVSPGGILAGQDEVFLNRYNSYCRGKGMLDSKDVVGSVLFLLSDAARYICGQNIVVDDSFGS